MCWLRSPLACVLYRWPLSYDLTRKLTLFVFLEIFVKENSSQIGKLNFVAVFSVTLLGSTLSGTKNVVLKFSLIVLYTYE